MKHALIEIVASLVGGMVIGYCMGRWSLPHYIKKLEKLEKEGKLK